MTLIGGEGSLNDAVAIVMYQTFSGFLQDGTSNETAGALLARFLYMLAGSVAVGLSVGILSTFIFRYVHIGSNRDRGLIAFHEWLNGIFCACRSGRGGRASAGERVSLIHSHGSGGGSAVDTSSITGGDSAAGVGTLSANEGEKGLVGYNAMWGHGGGDSADGNSAAPGGDAETGAAGAGGETPHSTDSVSGSEASPVINSNSNGLSGSASPNEDEKALLLSNLLRPYASINAVRAGAAASGAKLGLDGFGAHGGADVMRGEIKPDSSVYAQISFIMTLAYLSYMAAEAFHLSGVVSSLFCGIALNNFVRPLMTPEGKSFSEGTIRSLASVADTGSFFQVGVSIAMTIGTVEGINDNAGLELLGWTLLSILIGRALSIILLGTLVNYLRRPEDKIPVSWLALLWHAGLRGAGTYAFSLVFPTQNKDMLVDVTAAIVLFTVFGLGSTTQAAVYLLGVHTTDPHEAEPGDRHGQHKPLGDEPEKQVQASGDAIPHSTVVMSGGVAYRVFVKSGARVAVPVARITASEKTASWMSKVDSRLRYFISGVVRAD